jgi:hypothetical protein
MSFQIFNRFHEFPAECLYISCGEFELSILIVRTIPQNFRIRSCSDLRGVTMKKVMALAQCNTSELTRDLRISRTTLYLLSYKAKLGTILFFVMVMT